MKHWLLYLLSLTLLASCSLLQPRVARKQNLQVRDVPQIAMNNTGQPRKRVILLPFLDNKPTRSFVVAEEARKSVVVSLNRSGQFLVIRNSDFPQDLNQYKGKKNYNLEAIAKTAKSLGIAAVLEGTIIDVKSKRISDQVGLFRKIQVKVDAEVRIRAVAVKTGREILNEVRTAEVMSEATQVGEYEKNDAFLEKDPRLVRQVTQKAFQGTILKITQALDKLEWEGRIALVKGDRIYLNAGRLSGIQVGDILKVMEQGEEVFDPDTGVLIGRVPGRMKGTVEVVSYFGKDGAIGIVHSGSGFKENDRVELY